MEKPELNLDRPEDRSLAAFKRFITDILSDLGGNTEEGRLTEEQWTAKWKKFWEDEESGPAPEVRPGANG
jgi:hypothetical protein